MRRNPLLYVLPCALLAACPDCGDLIDRTGGNSELGYFSAEVVNLPVGGWHDLQIRDYEFLQEPEVTEVCDMLPPTMQPVVTNGGYLVKKSSHSG